MAKLSGANAGDEVDVSSTKAALEQAIADAFLGASTNALTPAPAAAPAAAAAAASGPVNDLSSMVKRKKKPDTEKRKVDHSALAQEASKKARVDSDA